MPGVGLGWWGYRLGRGKGWENIGLGGGAEDATLGMEPMRLGGGLSTRPGGWRGHGGRAQRTRVDLGVQEVGTVKSRARRMGIRKDGAGRVGTLYPRGRALELRGLEGRVGCPRLVKGGARVTKDMGRDREEGVTRRAADLSTRRVREGAGPRSRAMRKWTWAASGAGPDADAGGGARGRAQVSRAAAPSAPPPWVPSAGRADSGWRRLRPRPGPAPSWAAEPAPVAAAGEALPPASAARGGREGERPAQSVPVGGVG